MNRFKLQHLIVDVSRCQIIDGTQVRNIEPRSMDVLAYLARHKKRVISQEELFESLWPDTLFSSGAVQRCIAQLRKGLKDDARDPVFIITHPKRGYSLEVEPVTDSENHKAYFFGAGLLLLLVLFVWGIKNFAGSVPNEGFSGRLIPMTSHSDYDFFPLYGKEGRRLVFIRQQQGQRQGHIFVKDLESGVETQLTTTPQHYQSLAWSEDNLKLYFIIRNGQKDQVGELSLVGGKEAEHIIFTQQGTGSIWRVAPVEGQIFYMQADVPVNQSPVTWLKRFDMASNQHITVLQSSQEFTPYRIALSADNTRLVIAGEDQQNGVQLRVFDLNKQQLSEPFATLALGFTEVSWHPDGQSVLVHHLNRLYKITLDGEQTELPYMQYQRLYNPSYRPDGQRIVMSLTEQDSDLIEYVQPLGKRETVIDSSGEDHLARYSPDGEQLAFISSRTGTQQAYVKYQGREIIMFENPENLPVYRAPVWSPDGERISFGFGKVLYIYELDTQVLSQYEMPSTFTAVLDWYQDNNGLLIAIKQQNVSYFAQFNFVTRQIVVLEETGVNYSARLDANDQLVFYNESILSWGEHSYPREGMPLIASPIFIAGKVVVFQSARQVYQFDGQILSVLVEQIPEANWNLVDVSASGKLLFNSTSQQRAKIVALD